ncbi:MAG TPA: hypothetical protein DCZ91_23165 [Lachnospiraceae bacterium]|nr:hypothetical protein [Lachnospiraceae bacterium]
MRGKEWLAELARTYFILVTLITMATFLLGMYFDPDARFGYDAFLSPLIYAACGTVPGVVLYSRHELSLKAFLFRKILHFVLIEAIILSVAFPYASVHTERKNVVPVMGLCIFVIYVLVHGIEWGLDCLSARKMTEDLLRLQKSVDGNSTD